MCSLLGLKYFDQKGSQQRIYLSRHVFRMTSGEGGIGDGLCEERNMDNIFVLLLNPGVPGMAGYIVVD